MQYLFVVNDSKLNLANARRIFVALWPLDRPVDISSLWLIVLPGVADAMTGTLN